MVVRFYLLLVGLLYLWLSIWCAFSPDITSAKVGFELVGDSGSSEFLTVYGGLEFGLALILLMPLLRKDMAEFSLVACLLIHGSLVLFRGVSLILYSGFSEFTGRLAIGEWLIFLVGLTVYVALCRRKADPV